MTFLDAADRPAGSAGRRFRALVDRGGLMALPGAYNGLAALQAKHAGFEALYLSGAAMSASLGLPDLGILTVDDVASFIRQVARAGLPLLVDADTGYGEALNVMATVARFEAEGAAAIHLEDQQLPKKCGHLNDKRLVSPAEMAAKVTAAARARRDLYVIARTDAAASEGLDAAVDRSLRYLDAGADAIFPEALTTRAQFEDFARRVPAPLLANMTEFGRTPHFTADEFAAMGYRMLIWPVSALRVAAKAHETLYATLRERGTAEGLLGQMQTRTELYATIDYAGYEALDATIVQSTPPA